MGSSIGIVVDGTRVAELLRWLHEELILGAGARKEEP
jgi:hypothetical protein